MTLLPIGELHLTSLCGPFFCHKNSLRSNHLLPFPHFQPLSLWQAPLASAGSPTVSPSPFPGFLVGSSRTRSSPVSLKPSPIHLSNPHWSLLSSDLHSPWEAMLLALASVYCLLTVSCVLQLNCIFSKGKALYSLLWSLQCPALSLDPSRHDGCLFWARYSL